MSDQAPKKETWAERIAQLLGLKPNQANMVKMIAVALALGVLFLNAGDLFGVVDNRRPPADATPVTVPAKGEAPQDELARLEREYATRLEQSLSNIAGAGKVRVSVTLEAGPSIAVIADTRVDRTNTTEVATDQSKRETVTVNTNTTHVLTKGNGFDNPVVGKRSRAQVAGVLIVADGASHATVRQRLHDAAMIAFGVPGHRIQVVPGSGGK